MRKVSLAIAIATAMGLSACGAAPDQPAEKAVEQVAAPAHSWTYREGQEYGYEAQLSENDRKAGNGAPSVLMFRYLGRQGELYRIAHQESGVLVVSSCENPCRVLKVSVGGEVIQRVAFNPDTIVGSAMTDAINGQLEEYGSASQGSAPSQ